MFLDILLIVFYVIAACAIVLYGWCLIAPVIRGIILLIKSDMKLR
jgi:hypothetical protein